MILIKFVFCYVLLHSKLDLLLFLISFVMFCDSTNLIYFLLNDSMQVCYVTEHKKRKIQFESFFCCVLLHNNQVAKAPPDHFVCYCRWRWRSQWRRPGTLEYKLIIKLYRRLPIKNVKDIKQRHRKKSNFLGWSGKKSVFARGVIWHQAMALI